MAKAVKAAESEHKKEVRKLSSSRAKNICTNLAHEAPAVATECRIPSRCDLGARRVKAVQRAVATTVRQVREKSAAASTCDLEVVVDMDALFFCGFGWSFHLLDLRIAIQKSHLGVIVIVIVVVVIIKYQGHATAAARAATAVSGRPPRYRSSFFLVIKKKRRGAAAAARRHAAADAVTTPIATATGGGKRSGAELHLVVVVVVVEEVDGGSVWSARHLKRVPQRRSRFKGSYS